MDSSTTSPAPTSVVPGKNPVATRALAPALLLIALGISLFLAAHGWWQRPVPGCSEGAACQSVLNSKWAYLAGVPVSIFGVFLYAGILFFHLSGLRRLEIAACLTAIGAALWFTAVQLFILEALCPWCCATHASATIGALLLLAGGRRIKPSEKGSSRFGKRRWEFCLPLVLVAVVAFAQWFSRPPENVRTAQLGEDGLRRDASGISFYDGEFQIDPTRYPVIGLAEAPHLAVALTDYTCPYCLDLHRTLTEAEADLRDRLGVVMLPGFRDAEARELHRIMLPVYREDPAYFEELTQQWLDGSLPLSPRALLPQVQAHFEGRFYEIAWRHATWSEKTLRLGESLLAANDRRLKLASLPQLMLGEEILVGPPRLETILAALERAESGAPPLQPAAAPITPPGIDEGLRPQEPATGQPEIAFETQTLELPEVARGEKTKGRFVFRNTGTAPLKILDIKPSCGCTTVDGWQQTVLPGASGFFEVAVDTSRFPRDFAKSIEVNSNATNVRAGVSRVVIKGKIWMPVQLSSNAVSFGVLMKHHKVEPKEIDIRVTEKEPLEIGQPVSSNPYFETELQELEKGRHYKMIVSIPELKDAAQSGRITLPLGHPRMPSLDVATYARTANAVEINPKVMLLPPTPFANAMKRPVIVFCHDPAHAPNFAVTEVSVGGDTPVAVTIEPARPASTYRRIHLEFPKGYDATAAQQAGDTISVKTNHPDSLELTVPIQTNRPPPASR